LKNSKYDGEKLVRLRYTEWIGWECSPTKLKELEQETIVVA
jgi:hypothetical protein